MFLNFLWYTLTASQTPIIGVFMNPSKWNDTDPKNQQYILSSTADWFEQAGARILPIPFDSDEKSLETIFNHINGLMFPGGSLNLSFAAKMPGQNDKEKENIYIKSARKLLNLSISANKNGSYFPVYAECQGFELVSVLESNNDEILKFITNQKGVNRRLYLNQDGAEQSTMFQGLSQELQDFLINARPQYYYHELSVSKNDFLKSPYLSSQYKITSFQYNSNNKDDVNATQFVGAFESRHYPIYAIMSHPQYQQFLPGNLNSNKFEKSYLISQYIAEFIVNETKKNKKFNYDPTNYPFEEYLTIHKDDVKPKGAFSPIFLYDRTNFPSHNSLLKQPDFQPLNLTTLIVFVGVLFGLGCCKIVNKFGFNSEGEDQSDDQEQKTRRKKRVHGKKQSKKDQSNQQKEQLEKKKKEIEEEFKE